ncbi:MAG: GTP cyclohydrolase II [Acidobacteria bacterium]|nr:GTP cyclohydrolase II [Acidobacteriota bacterium]
MSSSLQMAAEARLPSRFGEFRIFAFEQRAGQQLDEAVALVMGELRPDDCPLYRIHSQCLTGDVFHSLRCDCRAQLEQAMEQIAAEGKGLIVYEMKEGRGIGIVNKVRAYALQDEGADTVEANLQLGLDVDLRDYRLPAAIAQWFGLKQVRLMSNNPEKIAALESAGIRVKRISAETDAGDQAEDYLRVKKEKLGHLIDGL